MTAPNAVITIEPNEREAVRSFGLDLLGGIDDSAGHSGVVKSLEAGRFDARSDRHLSLTPLALDDQGWKELGQILNGVVWDVLLLQNEAGKRLMKGKGDIIEVSLALLGFETDCLRWNGGD